MRDGFVKAAALTPKVRVADPEYNAEQIIKLIGQAERKGAKIMVFPELCISAYSCGDLFFQDLLLDASKRALFHIAESARDVDAIIFVGLPFRHGSKIYNVAAAVNKGRVLGLVPKLNIPNHNEFYERRVFTPGSEVIMEAALGEGQSASMGARLLFECKELPGMKIAAEICEDLWTPNPPSIAHAMAGATVVVNLSAGNEITGKDVYRRDLVRGQSARLICAYIYAGAGDGESTQDAVYSGHSLIAENGVLLAESERFCNESIYTEIDIKKLKEERSRTSTYTETGLEWIRAGSDGYAKLFFELKKEDTELSRFVDPTPFVPEDRGDRRKRCEDIFSIQAMGLKKRLEHTGSKRAVIGISGGLDSTLALLVTVRAFEMLREDAGGILAVTMPGFGTTERTHKNALNLIRLLGATLKEIDISKAARQHFIDIGHDENLRDTTYENAQARERTQILMDLANQCRGLVIGTGDLSELALGWATYNGDHMSMYGVNSSVPKTLVRHLISYCADSCNGERADVLRDILDTPVSPELLPPKDGEISQKTEDIVGPYKLHDFFLYHALRFGSEPRKVYRLAAYAFAGAYEKDEIKKWLEVFYRRFFGQQFKRSALPDGPKVGTVAVSPRGDLRMPSDACARLWIEEVGRL